MDDIRPYHLTQHQMASLYLDMIEMKGMDKESARRVISTCRKEKNNELTKRTMKIISPEEYPELWI